MKKLLATLILIAHFYGCNTTETKPKEEKKCVGTKYYDEGYKWGKYSRAIQPDENYRTYGVQYYRLQAAMLETDPNADCFDEGFNKGKDGE